MKKFICIPQKYGYGKLVELLQIAKRKNLTLEQTARFLLDNGARMR